MCWCGACLHDGMSCYLFGFAGRQFLLDDMICLRVRIVEEHRYEFLFTLTYCAGSHAHFVHLFNWWAYWSVVYLSLHYSCFHKLNAMFFHWRNCTLNVLMLSIESMPVEYCSFIEILDSHYFGSSTLSSVKSLVVIILVVQGFYFGVQE